MSKLDYSKARYSCGSFLGEGDACQRDLSPRGKSHTPGPIAKKRLLLQAGSPEAFAEPLTRSLFMEYRASMEALAPSTVNVRLSAVRKLVAEARKNGLIGVEHAASLLEVPNIRQKGTRLGNWPTREQAKELLGVPDRSTLKGKRDYVILALLVGCALRR